MAKAAVFGEFEAASAAALPGISFTGINAQHVDLTYGNIALDLSGVGLFEGDRNSYLSDWFGTEIFFASLFGGSDVAGMEYLSSFGVTWGEESFWILDDGVLASGWVSWDGIGGSDVPEPATLVILGLGLAGLGIARRRRK